MNKYLCIILIIALHCSNVVAREHLAADFRQNGDFFFGLATAPAHSEDNLDDSWLDFANSGGVAAFHNQPIPEQRLRFYSNPEVELDLARKTGAKVFRMGIDWGRLAPFKPGTNNCHDLGLPSCPANLQDYDALFRYLQIAQKAKKRGLKIMMTLFHHSLPKWAIDMGGWKNPKMVQYFHAFGMTMLREFDDYVDSWIIFNEPATFIMLSYIAGMWPTDSFNNIGLMGHHGDFSVALRHMAKAHKLIYEAAKKEITQKPIGVANNVSKHTSGGGVLNDITTRVIRQKLNYDFTDIVASHLDFHGVNYYGEEIVTGASVSIRNEIEYSESGRAINPNGLYETIKLLHERYNIKKVGRSDRDRKEIPFIITENGISDSTDVLRPSYLIEHLMAIHKARTEGIPINGYVFWTISDNWEWADGYCPKFGMVSVDRANNLKRTLRPSYHLFSKIAKSRIVTKKQREKAWQLVQNSIGRLRPFCRSLDGRSSLDYPTLRAITEHDWRFNIGN